MPQTWSSHQVRQTFIDFYAKKHAHTFIPSSPVVPHDDPTLLFTNAGMNQFKPLFLGNADPSTPMGRLKRSVNSQKCIRAGGKHNDLDDVGKDTYHHTFFEMLGTWSFGDYFKAESIDWAWELLTRVFGLPADRLYASYFGGSPDGAIEPDLETKAIWLRYLPGDRILPGNMKDNFWEMGDTGPCGPCSEIHFDRIGGRNAASLVNSGDPDVLEIWNHVFIQFNREEGGALRILPAKHIDTGMGFERLVSCLQNVRSNYDTDVFAPLFAAIERVARAPRPYGGKLGAADKDNVDTAYRVIADHIRTLTFAIADGAVPSNEGRGYVLRRILRRAVRYGRQVLGAKTGFFSELVPAVVDSMGDFFAELKADPQHVKAVLKDEEDSFGRTLERGIVLFDEACVRAYSRSRLTPHLQTAGASAVAHRVEQPGGGQGQWSLEITVPKMPHLSGSFKPAQMNPHWADEYFGPNRGLAADDAFKLYDTYGFPVDLTVLMAEERGLRVDLDGFNRLMEDAREKARQGNRFSAETAELALTTDAIAKLRHLNVQPTDDLDKFHGGVIRARVKAIWDGGDFEEFASASVHLKPVAIILDKTSFYAEMGGQLADHGKLQVTRESKSGSRDDADAGAGELRVEDVKSFGGYVAHIGRVVRKEIRVGDEVAVTVDRERRDGLQAHHTATHLLNLHLARVLGDGVNQKGSQVAHDRLRFDFSHSKPVSPEESERIENGVRNAIAADLRVYAESVSLAKGKQIPGLRAVFGEAYPDPVRVVSIGTPVPAAIDGQTNKTIKPGAAAGGDGLETSIEFCGGTHVASTAAIGPFALVSEEAVAKGVRRLTALCGVGAVAAEQAGNRLAGRLRDAERLGGELLVAEVHSIVQEIDALPLSIAVKSKLRAGVAALQEKVKSAAKAAAAGLRDQAVASAKAIADSPEWEQGAFIVTTIDAASDREALTAAMNTIRTRRPKQAVMLVSVDEAGGKLNILAQVPEALVKRGLAAGDWVRTAATVCGGKGGGKPDNAQGGGTDITKLKDVLAEAKKFAFAKCPN